MPVLFIFRILILYPYKAIIADKNYMVSDTTFWSYSE